MKVAIVGASGAVGQEFLRILAERDFQLMIWYYSARHAVQVQNIRSRVKNMK